MLVKKNIKNFLYHTESKGSAYCPCNQENTKIQSPYLESRHREDGNKLHDFIAHVHEKDGELEVQPPPKHEDPKGRQKSVGRDPKIERDKAIPMSHPGSLSYYSLRERAPLN
jgi:hypothetical protein